ncbi:peptidase inhibitor 16 [Python bivittatus]|uniref:Peptidase inhibitor 16 n=1 Tax=Python bivittatus TaxID=176946 RepID=A0A9F2NPS4_PYTBI|nr:peptidase inhibitor 16 [Python bivittatus]
MLSSGLRIPLLSLLLLLLSAMELSWSFTNEEKQKIVDQHNQYRSMVSPSAADMLKMRWDSELEAFAKDYSTKCIWEHNKERGLRGENLFAMSGRELDLERAMDEWYNEYQFYNISTLTCKEGEMCGHYTQVVWATSERVGCGTTFCKTLELTNDTDMHLFVCNYEPPGNIRGRKPYTLGAPCSMCPDDYSCTNALCESSADVEETTAPPTAPDLKSTATVSAADTPESPRIGTEAGSEPTAAKDQTAIPTTSPVLQSTMTVSAADTPESPKMGTEAGSEPTATKDQTAIPTTSPDLQSTMTVSAAVTPESPKTGTEARSEPTATKDQTAIPTTSPDFQSTMTVSAADTPESPKTGSEAGSEPTAAKDQTAIPTTSPDFQSTMTVSAADTPESPRTGTEARSEPTATKDQTAIPTTSPDLQSIMTVSAADTPESLKTGTEAGSEPTVTKGPTLSLQPISDRDLKVSDLQTDRDGIDGSLMTTISAMSFSDLNLPLSSISPETGTEKATGTELPSSADGLITTQTTMIKTEQPVITLVPVRSTSKTPSTPKRPSVPKSPSVPKPPSIAVPQIFPRPPPIPMKLLISKTPARHRLLAYSKAIQSRSNAFQSSAGKAASMSVCLPCLGCKQISQPEDIKAALKELTFRYPYEPCFGSLPRWQRHSKCSWCGHTYKLVGSSYPVALGKARPYWLNTL